MCEDFTKAGLKVVLIDNDSTFPPCVEWLSKCPYKVIHMKRNAGAWAFFITELYQEYRDQHFMISDSDQDISQLPSDWVEVLMKGLQETDDRVWKSGLSQKVDDLPTTNPYAKEIFAYESAFYSNVNRFGYYKVWMDLGIAIYDRSRRGEFPIKEEQWYGAVRSPIPYQSRHLDWYMTPDQFRPEDLYYLNTGGHDHDGWLFNWKIKYNK